MLKYPELKKVSFCITCMNRLHHLKHTLPINLQDTYPNLEIVLVNYSSTDNLSSWIQPYLNKIKYVEVHGKKYFHMAHAKNVAAKHATGDIIVNVDADNFTGTGFAQHISNLFASSQTIVAVGFDSRHTTGRIAMLRAHFIALTGYDEHMVGWGFEDIDLYHRAKLAFNANIYYIKQERFLHTVVHEDMERTMYNEQKEYQLTNYKNQMISKNNIKQGIIAPNETWGEV